MAAKHYPQLTRDTTLIELRAVLIGPEIQGHWVTKIHGAFKLAEPELTKNAFYTVGDIVDRRLEAEKILRKTPWGTMGARVFSNLYAFLSECGIENIDRDITKNHFGR